MPGAVHVRGRATGTRELDALSPRHLVSRVNAILLTGGSASTAARLGNPVQEGV